MLEGLRTSEHAGGSLLRICADFEYVEPHPDESFASGDFGPFRVLRFGAGALCLFLVEAAWQRSGPNPALNTKP